MDKHQGGLEEQDVLEVDAQNEKTNLVLVSDILPTDLMIFSVAPRPFFPGFPIPLIISGKKQVERISQVMETPPQVLGLVLKADPEQPDNSKNLYRVGVAGKVLKVIFSEKETVHLIVDCLERFTIKKMRSSWIAEVKYRSTTKYTVNEELKAYSMAIISTLKDLIQVNPLQGEPIKMFLNRSSLDDPDRLTDFAATLSSASGPELQEILEAYDVRRRIDKMLVILKKELDISRLQQKISKKIEEKITDQQREFFLKEQLKAIKKELGLEKEGKESEAEKFRKREKELEMNDQASRAFKEEMDKLKILEPISPEYNVSHNYLDWLTLLPWGRFSRDNYNLKRAGRVLDQDHFGLEDVKARILEFIAVGRLKGNVAGSILCLVGPPGVGKTSVGRSIARALKRRFYRFSLGGMRDEAEIKGHRRTYIGAMPGKFIQALKAVETANPVIMLDEIDKIGTSFRGDPASALLEVLDPEQNVSFTDHYLDVPFDLSRVLFIATANQVDTIPAPLLDRMEMIRLSGYILEEKLGIAQKFLIPKTALSHGVTRNRLSIRKKALTCLIDGYAREAGVRRLEQNIKKIFRKAVLKWVQGYDGKIIVRAKDLEHYLGHPPFTTEERLAPVPGIVTGLAWTSMGGATLQIEASAIHSKRKGFKQTGQLGEVMVESSEIAYSYVMAHLERFGGKPDFFDEHFVHLHVPSGATPKDGPSAGITMATALLSVILDRALPFDLAMTGELTLTGQVLPIGGVKEKVIAARRVNIRSLIFPEANRRDFKQLPDFLREGLHPDFVSSFDAVFKLCFPKS